MFNVWSLINSIAWVLVRFVVAVLVIAAAWYGFLRLVSKLPVDSNAALVMVWLSALIVLLALSPNLLNIIKQVEFMGVKIELQEAVAESSAEDYTALADLDQGILGEKGDFRNLQQLLNVATTQPTRPVLLIANLRDGHYISKPVLFIYAFFLEQVARSVTILFVAAPGATLEGITGESIIGAISARSLLKIIQRYYPRFASIGGVPGGEPNWLDDFLRGRIPAPDIFVMIRNYIWSANIPWDEQYLSKEEVQNWLGPRLSRRKIDINLGPTDLKTIRRALEAGEEFVISVEGGRLRSVIDLCEYTRGVTRVALTEALRKKS